MNAGTSFQRLILHFTSPETHSPFSSHLAPLHTHTYIHTYIHTHTHTQPFACSIYMNPLCPAHSDRLVGMSALPHLQNVECLHEMIKPHICKLTIYIYMKYIFKIMIYADRAYLIFQKIDFNFFCHFLLIHTSQRATDCTTIML